MSTETLDATTLETWLDEPLPCEHTEHGRSPRHSGDAYYLIDYRCLCGRGSKRFWICKSGYDMNKMLTHRQGGTPCWQSFGRDEVWRVVRTIEGTS